MLQTKMDVNTSRGLEVAHNFYGKVRSQGRGKFTLLRMHRLQALCLHAFCLRCRHTIGQLHTSTQGLPLQNYSSMSLVVVRAFVPGAARCRVFTF